MSTSTIDEINQDLQEAAHEDRLVQSLRESGVLLIGGSLAIEAYQHTVKDGPSILTAEAMLSEGPLAFVGNSIEEAGGLDAARKRLSEVVQRGLDLNTYWHAYTYTDNGYSDAYTPCARPGLHDACGADAGWVDLFADLGADLNLRCSEGLRPVRIAVRLGRADVMEALLRRGAKDDPGSGNYTLLHEAAERNDPATCELLLSAGASLVARDAMRGEVPLISAAAANSRAAFDCLLRHGASPHETDDKRNGAAHVAMGEDHPEMAFYAIEAGVDPDLLNTDGATAMAMGSKTSQERLQDLLRMRNTRNAAREALASMGLLKGASP